MLHDESIYSDPFDFKPERFLDASGDLITSMYPDAAFGFGRRYESGSLFIEPRYLTFDALTRYIHRICPGRYVADNSLYLAFACVLACFNIEHALDVSGKPIPVECKMTPQNIS